MSTVVITVVITVVYIARSNIKRLPLFYCDRKLLTGTLNAYFFFHFKGQCKDAETDNAVNGGERVYRRERAVVKHSETV